MARYKSNPVGEFGQGVFISLQLDEQFDEFSLEKVIGRFVDEEVHLEDFADKYKNTERGAAAYNPKVLLKVILYSFSKGINSSHQMEHLLGRHISYMYLSGCQQFDYSTICIFINKNADTIQKIFSRLLFILNEMGLIDWSILESDGTIASGNAAKELTGKKSDFEKKLARCEKYSRKLVERIEFLEAKFEKGEFSEALIKDEERKIKRQSNYYKNALIKIRDHLKRLDTNESDDKKVNLTDKDSVLLKQRDAKGFVQGYNVHCSFSNNDILLDIDATNIHNDFLLTEDIIRRLTLLKVNLQVNSKSLHLLDKGFFESQKIANLIKAGHDIYIPIPESIKWREVVIKENLPYIQNGDNLIKGKLDNTKGEYRFRYPADGKRKEISITKTFIDDRDLWEQYKEKFSSKDGKFIYGKRIGKEHNHFQLKELSSMRRIFRRGKFKVNLEVLLHGIGHNFQKYVKFLQAGMKPIPIPV